MKNSNSTVPALYNTVRFDGKTIQLSGSTVLFRDGRELIKTVEVDRTFPMDKFKQLVERFIANAKSEVVYSYEKL